MSGLELVSIPLVIALAIPNAVGILSGGSAADDIKGWYKTLRKPSFHPPDFLFGVIWTILYTATGFASFVVWTEGGFQQHVGAFVLYAAQLALNAAWAPAFFKAHSFSLASLLNLGMIVTASITAWSFYKVKPVAGWLFVPYLLWLLFANYLNAAVVKLNPQGFSSGSGGGGGGSSGSSSNSGSPGGAVTMKGTSGDPSGKDLPNSPWKDTATEPLYKQEGKENPGDPGYGDLRGRIRSCMPTLASSKRTRPLHKVVFAGQMKHVVAGRPSASMATRRPAALARVPAASAPIARALF